MSRISPLARSSEPVDLMTNSVISSKTAIGTFKFTANPSRVQLPRDFCMRRRSLLHRAGHPRHVVLDEERIQDRDRQRAEQGAGHQRTPVVDIAFDELGDDAD